MMMKEILARISDGFLSLAIACKKLFIAGEELFLAADIDGWLDSCNAIFGFKGYHANFWYFT